MSLKDLMLLSWGSLIALSTSRHRSARCTIGRKGRTRPCGFPPSTHRVSATTIDSFIERFSMSRMNRRLSSPRCSNSRYRPPDLVFNLKKFPMNAHRTHCGYRGARLVSELGGTGRPVMYFGAAWAKPKEKYSEPNRTI